MAALLVADRRGRAAVVVAGEKNRGLGQRGAAWGDRTGSSRRDAALPAAPAPAAEAAAHVILVGGREERAGERDAPGLRGLHDGVDLPRRVDDHALARLRIADEVDEILHRPQLHLLEVDRLVRHGHHPTPVTPTTLECPLECMPRSLARRGAPRWP